MNVHHLELSLGYILNDIIEAITPSLSIRREATRHRGDYAPSADYPVTGPELQSFIAEFVSRYPLIGEAVGRKPQSYIIEIPEALYGAFLRRISDDAGHPNWLGADGPHYVKITKHLPEIFLEKSSNISRGEKLNPIIAEPARIHAPSLNVILSLVRRHANFDSLKWRQLEELIAELLKCDGYDVELGRGTKDGGADLIAHKMIPRIGLVRSVWQAKHLKSGSKVGLSIVRELADVRNELHATKGFIVTSSFLTRGALDRIRRDQYQLGKIERPELESWIKETLG